MINDDLQWTGGSHVHAVFMGDYFDRGPQSLLLIQILLRIKDLAKAAGSHVHLLIGNHELMVFGGDLRYCEYPDVVEWTKYARRFFVPDHQGSPADSHKSPQQSDPTAVMQISQLLRLGSFPVTRRNTTSYTGLFQLDMIFDSSGKVISPSDFPLIQNSLLGYLKFFSGSYPARRLANEGLGILQIGPYLFTHAGLVSNPLDSEHPVTISETMNDQVRSRLNSFLEMNASTLRLLSQGTMTSAMLLDLLRTRSKLSDQIGYEPLWSRSLVNSGLSSRRTVIVGADAGTLAIPSRLPSTDLSNLVKEDPELVFRMESRHQYLSDYLSRHGARRLVVGHTMTTSSKPELLFPGGELLVIDTGISLGQRPLSASGSTQILTAVQLFLDGHIENVTSQREFTDETLRISNQVNEDLCQTALLDSATRIRSSTQREK